MKLFLFTKTNWLQVTKIYYEPNCLLLLSFRCVALLYILFIIQQNKLTKMELFSVQSFTKTSSCTANENGCFLYQQRKMKNKQKAENKTFSSMKTLSCHAEE